MLFYSRRLHFIHLGVNSLLPNIEELRNIAKLSNAAVIGISESKLDGSAISSKIHIGNCNTLSCNWNINGGGVVCYIRTDLSYDVKSFFRLKLKTFSITTKYVGIIYRPPSQSELLEIKNTHFSKLHTNNNENLNTW